MFFRQWPLHCRRHTRGFFNLFQPKSSTSVVLSNYHQTRESWLNPAFLLVGFIPIFTFGLGTWQLQRLKWKVNLIDELEEKLQLEPLPLPKRINLDVLPEFIWRKVVAKGRWDHSHSMILSPRVREGVHGAHIITPLIRNDSTTILVDRGFVKSEVAENNTYTREEGQVEVLGMLRMSQPRNIFTPTNRPLENKWFWVDADAMAKYAGGTESLVQPVFVEQIFNGHAGDAALCMDKGIPVGRAASVDLRNAHLSYVITWFGLSALTSFMFARVLINKKKSVRRPMPRNK